MNEKIISTTDVFDGRVVHLKVHSVELPDGSQSKREIIHHRGAAAIVAVDPQQYVLLVKQFRLGAEQVMFEIPAGLLEPNEDPEKTVVRELREETGYRPLNVESLGGFYMAPGYSTEFLHLYYASDYEHAPLELDADEFVEVVRMPFKEALAMIDDGKIVDSKSTIGLLKVARRLGL